MIQPNRILPGLAYPKSKRICDNYGCNNALPQGAMKTRRYCSRHCCYKAARRQRLAAPGGLAKEAEKQRLYNRSKMTPEQRYKAEQRYQRKQEIAARKAQKEHTWSPSATQNDAVPFTSAAVGASYWCAIKLTSLNQPAPANTRPTASFLARPDGPPVPATLLPPGLAITTKAPSPK
jgi:hypothetical protein